MHFYLANAFFVQPIPENFLQSTMRQRSGAVVRLFQMRAPATGKAREPMEVSRTAGTIRSSEVRTGVCDEKVYTSVTWTTCCRLWYFAGQITVRYLNILNQYFGLYLILL